MMTRQFRIAAALIGFACLSLATGPALSKEHPASSVRVTVEREPARERPATSVRVTVDRPSSSYHDDDRYSSRTSYHEYRTYGSSGNRQPPDPKTALVAIGLLALFIIIMIFAAGEKKRGATAPREGDPQGGGTRADLAGSFGGARVVEAYATLTCDCGTVAEIPLSNVAASVTCAKCGTVNRLSGEAIATVKAAAVDAYRAADAAVAPTGGRATAVVDLAPPLPQR